MFYFTSVATIMQLLEVYEGMKGIKKGYGMKTQKKSPPP
jgi:hypothetical protein